MLASLSWNVGKGKPLKEYKVERCFRAKKKYKHASKQTLRFTSEVISLAVLWTDSRTYQGNSGEFLPFKQNNGYNKILVGLGGPKISEMGIGSLLRSRYDLMTELPRTPFEHKRAKLSYASPALRKWLKHIQR